MAAILLIGVSAASSWMSFIAAGLCVLAFLIICAAGRRLVISLVLAVSLAGFATASRASTTIPPKPTDPVPLPDGCKYLTPGSIEWYLAGCAFEPAAYASTSTAQLRFAARADKRRVAREHGLEIATQLAIRRHP